jgi:hypothetical protein
MIINPTGKKDMEFVLLTSDEAVKLRINYPDIYFTPQYGKLSSSYIWECATSKNNDIIYVYLKQPIIFNRREYYDLKTPPGYAGYYISDEVCQDKIEKFIDWFRMECKKRRYTTEFIRINPYILDISKITKYYKAEYSKSTYSIDVTDDFMVKTNKKNRNMIRKGIKMGLEFEIEPVSNLLNFRKMYNATMDRKSAKKSYYFNDEYFNQLKKINCHLVKIRNKDGNILMMSLFLVFSDKCHYHLSCKDEKCVNAAANYMFYRVVNWCSEKKIKMIHLGGGLRENDGLAKFKERISNNKHDYYYVKHVNDPKIYQTLVDSCDETGDFFPIYRKKE